jgi:hypothetical protein
MTRTRTSAAKPPFRQKEPDRRALTSERIADDIEAFQSSGGHIEVLGVTRVLTKLDDAVDTHKAPSAQPRGGTRRA